MTGMLEHTSSFGKNIDQETKNYFNLLLNYNPRVRIMIFLIISVSETKTILI